MIANALDTQNCMRVELALDIGCGPGAQLSDWKKYARRVVGLDQYADQISPDFFDGQTTLIAGDVTDLPFDDNSMDLVLALDVIEHLPEAPVLNEAMRVLKPGGTLLITVPAFQWLWSYRDEDAGHLRRYSKGTIKQAIEQSGFRVNRMRYYQFFLLPLVVLSRFFGRTSRTTRDLEDFPPAVLNVLFRAINSIEARLDKLGLSMPAGSSIIVLATKS